MVSTKCIRNILSLRNLNKKKHIIYDYDNGNRFIVIITRPGEHDIIFTANNDRIYYNDMRNT